MLRDWLLIGLKNKLTGPQNNTHTFGYMPIVPYGHYTWHMGNIDVSSKPPIDGLVVSYAIVQHLMYYPFANLNLLFSTVHFYIYVKNTLSRTRNV